MHQQVRLGSARLGSAWFGWVEFGWVRLVVFGSVVRLVVFDSVVPGCLRLSSVQLWSVVFGLFLFRYAGSVELFSVVLSSVLLCLVRFG